MYEWLDPSRRLSKQFITGVSEFVSKAIDQTFYTLEGGIRCPCIKCVCEKILPSSHVRAHLLRYGFKPNYTVYATAIFITLTIGNWLLTIGNWLLTIDQIVVYQVERNKWRRQVVVHTFFVIKKIFFLTHRKNKIFKTSNKYKEKVINKTYFSKKNISSSSNCSLK